MDERNPRGNDWVEDAKTEISGMAKQGLDHPSSKPVIAGAAIGALAAGLLPVVTWPIGLVAGAGFALYNRIKK
ncbi:MAG: hypothetical protein EON59_12640 [Alphaproteobacteria bacterium]|jgi:hypothetical protein|nr:MAG: hypothetical protein EON59_12640 [Alphaproteobacteria bacterium]